MADGTVMYLNARSDCFQYVMVHLLADGQHYTSELRLALCGFPRETQ